MVSRGRGCFGQTTQKLVDQVIQHHSGQHGRVEQGWEVVVEVQDPTHGPERHIMQQPSGKQPQTSVQCSVPLPSVGLIDEPSFLTDSTANKDDQKEEQKDQISPPNDRIAK